MCSIVGNHLPGRPGDGDHVEAGGIFQQAMAFQEAHRQPGEPPLLLLVHGLGRMAGLLRLPRLDLDEDDRLAVQHHQIEFAGAELIAAGENLVAAAAEKPGRRRLAPLAERLLRKQPLDQLP